VASVLIAIGFPALSLAGALFLPCRVCHGVYGSPNSF
jgi:hypothetical protein